MGLNLTEIVNNKIRTFADELALLEKEKRIKGVANTVFANNGTSKPKKKGSYYPKTVEGPTEIEAGKEAVYDITEFKLYKGKKDNKDDLAKDKTKVSWVMYIQGIEIKNNLLKYIELRGFDKKEITESQTDFMEITDIQKRTAAILQYGITYFKLEGEKKGEKTKLTVKFSKWLDGYNIHIEAYLRKPNLNPSKSYVVTTKVKAQPEILETYWVNDNKDNIINKTVGYKDTVYMYLKTLGMQNKTAEIQLWEEDYGWGDEQIKIKNPKFEIKNRYTYKKLELPQKDNEEFKKQRGGFEGDDLELFFKLPHETKTKGFKNAFAKILTLTPHEKLTHAYFAIEKKRKKINDSTLPENEKEIATEKKVKENRAKKQEKAKTEPCYEPIKTTTLGSEVWLVVESVNLQGKKASIELFDNEQLFEKDNKTPIRFLKDDKEVTKIKDIYINEEGIAKVKIKLRPKDDKNYKKLKDKFKDDKLAKLFLKVTCEGDEGKHKKEFLDNEGFEVKKSDIIYIYHSGHITKIDNLLEKEKISYVYIDKNNKQHDLGSFNITKAQKWNNGTKKNKSGNKNWKKVKIGSKTRYFEYGTGKVPLIKVKLPISYDKDGIKITLKDNTNREYINPEAYACLLGALAENDYKDLTFNGFTSKDGTGAPSVSHYNGIAGDFRYLRKDKNVASLHIDTSPDDLDVKRTEKFIDALIKFGWNSFYSYNIVLNKKSFRLKKDYTSHLVHHHHHLHLRRESFKPNYK